MQLLLALGFLALGIYFLETGTRQLKEQADRAYLLAHVDFSRLLK